eukprot:SAG31_NODE_6367_length_2042_cov_1.389089_1_plen_108_part_00
MEHGASVTRESDYHMLCHRIVPRFAIAICICYSNGLLLQARLGDSEGGDINKLFETDLAAALSANAGLLYTSKWGARAAPRVGVDATNSSLQFRSYFGPFLQIICPH